MLRRLTSIFAIALALVAMSSQALAQVCPAVAALPDSERRVAYSPSASTGPFSITFGLYGTGVDYTNWLEVWLNGVRLTAVTDFTVTLTSGTLATACRPLTNAQVTLVAPGTGTLQIVGAERPRRLSQFANNQPVAARDLNVAITDLVAQNRETWDKLNDVTGRAIVGLPGETLTPLQPAATRAGKFFIFDGAGNPSTTTAGVGTGNVLGPGTAVVNNIALWNNTAGTLLKDSGISIASLVSTAAQNVFTQQQFINLNTAVPVGGPPTILHLQSADGTQRALRMDAFVGASATNISSYLLMRVAGGTAAAPSATPSGFEIGVVIGRGYGTTGYSTQDSASMAFETTEAWTDAAQGTGTRFFLTPLGTTTPMTHSVLDATTAGIMRTYIGQIGQTSGELCLTGSTGGSACFRAANSGFSFEHTWGGGNTNSTLTFTGNFTTAGAVSLPAIVQGDLWYGSAAGAISALAKNVTPTRYLSNTGASNNPAWAQVDLTNGVTGVLPVANGGVNATAWTAFTPGFSCGTATFSVNTARQKLIGKTQLFMADATITAIGTCSGGNVSFNLPTAMANSAVFVGIENAITGYSFTCGNTAGAATAACFKFDGSLTWALNNRLIISGAYEIP